MAEQTSIPNLTFPYFKTLCLRKVRKDNFLDLVDSWQENILHSEFSQNKNGNYYAATIYLIEESYKNDYFLKMYNYSYLVDCGTFFINGYQLLDRTVLHKIAYFENLTAANKDKYLFCVIKQFHVSRG